MQIFDDAEIPWVRLNTEDAPKNAIVTIDPAALSGRIFLSDSQRSIELSAVKAVWYRKPDSPNLSHFALSEAGLEYVEAEFNEILLGTYALLNHVLWINNPLTSRLAHRKLLQLSVARQVGLETPPTVVTNDLDEALAFAKFCDWNLAIKSLGSISVTRRDSQDVQLHYGIFTRRVGREELLSVIDSIRHMPTLFQKYIPKDYELRVTCVGRRVFCCKIYSQESADGKEDSRLDLYGARHELCDWPELSRMLLAYLDAFDLNFGCFDLAVTPDGQPVFFECNPNGQWLWIEELTGAPISRAIADLLLSPHRV